jgi:hypothetical protein
MGKGRRIMMNDFELTDSVTVELTKLQWLMIIQGLQRNKLASKTLAEESKKRGLEGDVGAFKAVPAYHEDMIQNQEAIDLIRKVLFTPEQIQLAEQINDKRD